MGSDITSFEDAYFDILVRPIVSPENTTCLPLWSNVFRKNFISSVFLFYLLHNVAAGSIGGIL